MCPLGSIFYLLEGGGVVFWGPCLLGNYIFRRKFAFRELHFRGGGAVFSQDLPMRIILNGAIQAKLQGAGQVCSSLEEVVGSVKGFLRAV